MNINNADTPSTPVTKRRKLAFFYWGIFIVLLVIAFLVWLFIIRFEEYTDDAYVEGNQVYITPLRPGFIKAIHTDDTFLVKRGQLLIELDKTDSEIRLQKSKNELAKITRELCQQFHSAFAYKAEIEVMAAELVKAAQDYRHRYEALPAEAVSLEDYQHAVAALRANYFALRKTESVFDQTFSFIQGTSIKNHPLVQFYAEQLRDAFVFHYRCNIYAPVDGLAAQRKIQVGMWVNSGHPLLSVIPLDQIWVNANFKETQLKKMRIGQKVKITSDLYGRDVVYHGTIHGLPGAAGNAFSLLPPQNLSGNWIKIVQRLPVRVGLDLEELKDHPLRVGLSMEATVDLRDQEGKLVPLSGEGSPTYRTSIFDEEEKGAREMIEAVLNENIDPALSEYAENPLYLEKKELDPQLINLIPPQ